VQITATAIQLKVGLDDYLSFDAFSDCVSRSVDQAAGATKNSDGHLIILPEYLGLYLSFIPFNASQAQKSGSMVELVGRLASADRREIQHTLFGKTCLEVQAFYDDLFSGLAKKHGAYIVAGSLCIPQTDNSPHRGGPVIIDECRIFNISPTFAPSGRCIGRTAKVRIPPGEDQLIDPASLDQLTPIQTSIGAIGVALCYDGYHHGPLEKLDGLGAQIIAQPVHFPSPAIRFDGSGGFVPQVQDFAKLIQGRENIRYGVTAALVGEVFPDRRAEGVSYICANQNQTTDDWEATLLARSEDPFKSANVSALLEI
jgi:predicted amidohydrolase